MLSALIQALGLSIFLLQTSLIWPRPNWILTRWVLVHHLNGCAWDGLTSLVAWHFPDLRDRNVIKVPHDLLVLILDCMGVWILAHLRFGSD